MINKECYNPECSEFDLKTGKCKAGYCQEPEPNKEKNK